MQNDIAFWLAAIILGALGVLLTVATKYLISYFHQRVSLLKDDSTKNLLNSLIDLAGEKVLMAEQTAISGIKKDLESGKVKKDDLPALLAAVKQQTIDAVKRDASAMGTWSDAVSLFGKSENAEKWVADVIESHVHNMTLPSNLSSSSGLPAAVVAQEAVMLAK